MESLDSAQAAPTPKVMSKDLKPELAVREREREREGGGGGGDRGMETERVTEKKKRVESY